MKLVLILTATHYLLLLLSAGVEHDIVSMAERRKGALPAPDELEMKISCPL